MKVLSQEHLERLVDELKVINMAYNELRQNWNMHVRSLGIETCQAAINQLNLERTVLQLKIDGLHKFLTE